MNFLDYAGLSHYDEKLKNRNDETYLNLSEHVADPTKEDNIFEITPNGMYVPSQKVEEISKRDIEELFSKPVSDLTGYTYYLVPASESPDGIAWCWITAVDFNILGYDIEIPIEYIEDNVLYKVGIDNTL